MFPNCGFPFLFGKFSSHQCQVKHWRADHRLKCKQMKLLQPSRKITNEVSLLPNPPIPLFFWFLSSISYSVPDSIKYSDIYLL